jgi:hypothetical protein
MMFQNRVLRGKFGPNKEGERGGCRKLNNVELRNLYASPNIIRVIKSRSMRWAGQAACMGHEKCHNILIGKPEGKRPLWKI